jgi:hypothetical protein
MKRLVLTLFLLAFALGVNAFLGGRVDYFSLRPTIIDYQANACTRTFRVIEVSNGSSILDFYVLKKDPLDPSKWIFFQGPFSANSNTISSTSPLTSLLVFFFFLCVFPTFSSLFSFFSISSSFIISSN